MCQFCVSFFDWKNLAAKFCVSRFTRTEHGQCAAFLVQSSFPKTRGLFGGNGCVGGVALTLLLFAKPLFFCN